MKIKYKPLAASLFAVFLAACASGPRTKIDVTVNDQCLITQVQDGANIIIDFSQACADERLKKAAIDAEIQKNATLAIALQRILDSNNLSVAQKALAAGAILDQLLKEETPLGFALRAKMNEFGITDADLKRNVDEWEHLRALDALICKRGETKVEDGIQVTYNDCN